MAFEAIGRGEAANHTSSTVSGLGISSRHFSRMSLAWASMNSSAQRSNSGVWAAIAKGDFQSHGQRAAVMLLDGTTQCTRLDSVCEWHTTAHTNRANSATTVPWR